MFLQNTPPKVDWQVEGLFDEKAILGIPISALWGFALIVLYIVLKSVIGLHPALPDWLEASIQVIWYLLLLITLFGLCRILLTARLEKSEEDQYYRVLDLSRAPRISIGLLLTLIFTVFYDTLVSRQMTVSAFWDQLLLLLPLLLAALVVLLLLRYFINDYFKRTLKYISYFYPSILTIAILAFVISKQEQFDSFFIEMMSSFGNLLIFSVLFFVSIIIVWFAPSYLLFTDNIRFPKPEEAKDAELPEMGLSKLFINAIRLPPWLLARLLSPLLCRPLEMAQYYGLIWKHKAEVDNRFKSKESTGFIVTRVVLGLLYITTLATLAGRVYLKSRGLEYLTFTTHIALLSLLLPILFSYIHYYKRSRRRAITKLEKPSTYSSEWASKVWWIYVVAFVLPLTVVLSSVTLNPDYWQLSLALFIVTTLITSVTFTKIALFLHTDREDYVQPINRNFVSTTLMANANVAIAAVVVLLLLLLLPFTLTYPVIEWFNTINIYLLLVNGFIALLTILDRYLKIRDKIKARYKGEVKPGLKRSTASSGSWAIALLLLCLALYFNRVGNDYHQIPYQEESKANLVDESISLEDYTRQFLDKLNKDTSREESRPIICLAADGGGLKAAYWTMSILHRLDSMGLYEENLFLLSGASGGSLGQGLYTYMKAQGMDRKQISQAINKLGKVNFISGDLAGLLTRWPINYIPDINSYPESSYDRMEAMAYYYFKIINQVGGLEEQRWQYDSLRQYPYHYWWAKNDYQLPLFITNTARAEDGIKGWSHPLKKEAYLEAGVVDLTRRVKDDRTSYISFPDALFLTNRFPIMSPAARIYGKGHFVDAGAIDNSGMGTILQLLHKLKGKEGESEVFRDFFKHKVILISTRNDRSRFIYGQFIELVNGCMGETDRRSELNSFFGSVVSAGITGEPKVLDEIVKSGEAKALLGIDTLYELALPFRLNFQMVVNTYKRELQCMNQEAVVKSIEDKIEDINREIEVLNAPPIVEPPLGRLISEPARKYMDNMMRYETIQGVWEALEDI